MHEHDTSHQRVSHTATLISRSKPMAAQQPRALTVHHHTRRHLVLIVLTVAATAAARAASAHHTAAPAPRAAESPSPAVASFVRARCAATLYPALCYDCLLPYASEVQENPARLARVAADVAAARLHALCARVKDILRHGAPEPNEGGGGGRPSEAAALRDCASTTSGAADLARQSSAELTKLEMDLDAAASSAAGGRKARWEVSNAKTWLSAAVTNQGTCADGLAEAGAADSPAGKEVAAGVAAVQQCTSNALALVNGIPL
jgi:pectinesterase inhibitor-like protein